jgi:hypothetical protein
MMAQPASSQLGITIGTPSWLPKLELVLQRRATMLTGHSRVIIRSAAGVPTGLLTTLVLGVGGTLGRTLGVINAQVADIPNVSIAPSRARSNEPAPPLALPRSVSRSASMDPASASR